MARRPWHQEDTTASARVPLGATPYPTQWFSRGAAVTTTTTPNITPPIPPFRATTTTTEATAPTSTTAAAADDDHQEEVSTDEEETPAEEEEEEEDSSAEDAADAVKYQNNALLIKVQKVGVTRSERYWRIVVMSAIVEAGIGVILLAALVGTDTIPIIPPAGSNFLTTYSAIGFLVSAGVLPLALFLNNVRRVPNPVVPFFTYYIILAFGMWIWETVLALIFLAGTFSQAGLLSGTVSVSAAVASIISGIIGIFCGVFYLIVVFQLAYLFMNDFILYATHGTAPAYKRWTGFALDDYDRARKQLRAMAMARRVVALSRRRKA